MVWVQNMKNDQLTPYEVAFLWSRRRLWGTLAVVLIVSVWWGVPTFKKWRADKLVDELCAKDGRGIVYETVSLPAEKFVNGFVQVHISSLDHVKPTDEYYYISDESWIIPESNTFGGLDLYRYHYKLFRVKDGKLMSEYVSYSRRGGDPIGPWHPSSYSCKEKTNANVYPKTFVLKQNGGRE